MRIEITNTWAGLVFALGIVLTLTRGIAWAANRGTLSEKSTVAACANKVTGVLRIVGQKACDKTETAVSWGATGPAGPQGPAGSPGISGLQIVQYGSGFTYNPAVTVSCPAGKKIIGGGYDTEVAGHPGVEAPFPWITQNHPDGTGQWVLAGTNPPTIRDWKIQGYAICAAVQG